MSQLRKQRQRAIPGQLVEGQVAGAAGILRDELDPIVRPRVNLRVGAQTDGGVERLRAVMKEIERPDVDGAAGEVDSRRLDRSPDGSVVREAGGEAFGGEVGDGVGPAVVDVVAGAFADVE